MENDISRGQFMDFSVVHLKEPKEILEKCIGSNQKKLLVVYNEKDESPERTEFLKKILGAAKFDMSEDILLLKLTEKEPFSFISLRTKAADHLGGIDNMLVFGFEPSHFGLNLDVQKYQSFSFYDSGFLFADALSVLEKEKQLKGALWGGMQALFLK